MWQNLFSGRTPGKTSAQSYYPHLFDLILEILTNLIDNPRSTYRCNEAGCTRTFVRSDLLRRHQQRHGITTDSTLRATDHRLSQGASTLSPSLDSSVQTVNNHTVEHDNFNNAAGEESANTSNFGYTNHDLTQLATFCTLLNMSLMIDYSRITPNGPEAPDDMNDDHFHEASNDLNQPVQHQTDAIVDFTQPLAYGDLDIGMDAPPTDFATWLFDADNAFGELQSTNFAFLDSGLANPSFENTYLGDDAGSYGLLGSEHESPLMLEDQTITPLMLRPAHEEELWQIISSFDNQPDEENESLIRRSLSLQVCLDAFWDHISLQVSIIHKATFSVHECHSLLLLTLIVLGATVAAKNADQQHADAYYRLALDIATPLRWKICTNKSAQPPAALWTMQALLLLEVYEKLFSTRPLHERAHVYHSVTLNLIRRGSPLVQGSPSPSPEHSPKPLLRQQGLSLSPRQLWWQNWVQNETTCRVVFLAFTMDITHAVMFGHSTDMQPHEIQIRLPHDDLLWTAASATEFFNAQLHLRMYNIKPMNFLDGLKRALHCRSIQLHPSGRMILLSGLISVVWYTLRRLAQQKSLDHASNPQDTAAWQMLVSKAIQKWESDFSTAIGPDTSRNSTQNGMLDTLSSLSFLAYLSMNVDVVDLQIFSGCTKLLGRRITTYDHHKAEQRINEWVHSPVGIHITYEAIKVLYQSLVTRFRQGQTQSRYSAALDQDPSRPWILYLAALTMYTFVRRSGMSANHSDSSNNDLHERTCLYLKNCKATKTLEDLRIQLNLAACADILEVLYDCFVDTRVAILQEARSRLWVCSQNLRHPN